MAQQVADRILAKRLRVQELRRLRNEYEKTRTSFVDSGEFDDDVFDQPAFGRMSDNMARLSSGHRSTHFNSTSDTSATATATAATAATATRRARSRVTSRSSRGSGNFVRYKDQFYLAEDVAGVDSAIPEGSRSETVSSTLAPPRAGSIRIRCFSEAANDSIGSSGGDSGGDGQGGPDLSPSRAARVLALTAQVTTSQRAAESWRSKAKRFRSAAVAAETERDKLRAALAGREAELAAFTQQRTEDSDSGTGTRSTDASSAHSHGPEVARLREQLAAVQAQCDAVSEENKVAQDTLQALREMFASGMAPPGLAFPIDMGQVTEELSLDRQEIEQYEALLAETTTEVDVLRTKLGQASKVQEEMYKSLLEVEQERDDALDSVARLEALESTGSNSMAAALEKSDFLELRLEEALRMHDADQKQIADLKAEVKDLTELQDQQFVHIVADGSGNHGGSGDGSGVGGDASTAVLDQLRDELRESVAQRNTLEETLAGLLQEYQAREEQLRSELQALRRSSDDAVIQLDDALLRAVEAERQVAQQEQLAAVRDEQPSLMEELTRQTDKIMSTVDTQENPFVVKAQAAALRYFERQRQGHLETEEWTELVQRNRQVTRRNLLFALQRSVQLLVEHHVDTPVDDTIGEVNELCMILEQILEFGLRSRATWLDLGKPSLWMYVKALLRSTNIDCIENIERLDDIKTHRGRGRAWMRVALMEKKLADYFRKALRDKNTQSWYDDYSILRQEEGEVVAGFLVALNALDCNFCLKGNTLDIGDETVVDYARYMALSTGPVDEVSSA